MAETAFPNSALGEDTLYPPEAVADMLHCSPRTLAEWRLSGRGPRFVKLGRNCVRYRLGDVRSFVTAGIVTNSGGRHEPVQA